ncbi:hypothetical protein [Nitrosopumilus sp.]|uniref:hypothetical protein n=1 Tax=Nitrosopumilus sp. TaxID=2024843 RepID=UPI003B5C64B3
MVVGDNTATAAVQFNLRIKPDTLEILQHVAKGLNLTPSSLGAKIITDYLEFYYYKIQRGDIILSPSILKAVFKAIDPKKIDQISHITAKHILSEIKSQEGKTTYDVLVGHFLKWNHGNHIVFNKISQKDSDLFVSKHSICRNWSEIQCKTYASVFEMVGQTIVSKDYDSDDSYSLEVAKPDQIV